MADLVDGVSNLFYLHYCSIFVLRCNFSLLHFSFIEFSHFLYYSFILIIALLFHCWQFSFLLSKIGRGTNTTAEYHWSTIYYTTTTSDMDSIRQCTRSVNQSMSTSTTVRGHAQLVTVYFSLLATLRIFCIVCDISSLFRLPRR